MFLAHPGQKVSFSEDKDKASPSSVTSQGSESNLNLGSSFVKRTRYLSRSPMEGPSAFMVGNGYNFIALN